MDLRAGDRREEGSGVVAVPDQLRLIGALGAMVGILAAVRPARRAARLDVPAAVTTE